MFFFYILVLLKFLKRPGMEEWMYDEHGKLRPGQVSFDWKEVPFREDMLGGYRPNMLPGRLLQAVDVDVDSVAGFCWQYAVVGCCFLRQIFR
jgi:hypothetical protein